MNDLPPERFLILIGVRYYIRDALESLISAEGFPGDAMVAMMILLTYAA